jgi:hypothetical protein
MKKILSITCALISICSFCQTNTISWYKLFRGKIDKYAVTLHIHKAGHAYAGYYYYDSQQSPIYFSGDDTTVKGKIQLFSYTDSEESEYFIFSLQQSTATGNWKKTEKTKPLPFAAVETAMPAGFAYVFTSGSAKLRPKWKESPQATYSAASIWPTGKTATDEFLKTEIRHSFSEKNTGEDIGTLLLRTKKELLSGYISDNKDVKDAELKEGATAYTMDVDDKLLVAFQSAKILSLAFTNYAYTGGAHGNYGTSYTSIDLTSNKVLVLDNMINETGKKVLRSLLEKNFRKQYDLKPVDSLSEGGLFENKIEPNENFYVTGKGIGFCYNPYEIGPYAMGEINIFIPFTDLENYLKESFKKLLE